MSESRCHGHEDFVRAAMFPRGSSAADISGWRSTRHSAPPLSLIVREISSVSATFILSFSIADESLDIASLVQEVEDDGAGENDKSRKQHPSLISDILAKGLLSVNVNGTHWQHIIIRVAENGEEAVIIIYGLFPGRQYKIDLGLGQDGQSSTVQSQFTTEGEFRCGSVLHRLVTIYQDQNHLESVDTNTESEHATVDHQMGGPVTDHRRGSSHVSSASTSSSSSFVTETESSHTSQSSSSPEASPTSSESPTQNGITISTEEHVNQLQETLNMLITERDALTVNLKSTRRESQKADAALRVEIETLQRSSEKHGVSEQRAKQKVLALQEAQKRAIAAAEETEERRREVEALLPDLVKKKEGKARECQKLEAEAAKVRKEREQVEEAEKKQIESMKGELAALNHKLEKLAGKKDKLESGTIPDLEMQLQQVVEEIDKMEAEERTLELAYPNANSFYHNQTAVNEMGILRHPNQASSDNVAQQPQHRGRHHSFHSTPSLGRQSIPSSQRSNTLQAPSASTTRLWNTAPSHKSQVQRPQHNTSRFTYPQSNSLSQIGGLPPIILTNPNRKPTTASGHQTHSSANGSFSSLVSSPSSNSSSSMPSPNSGTLTSVPEQIPVSSTASTSTLSSRAPVFEPGQGLGLLSKLQRSSYAPTGTTNNGTGTGSRSTLASRWKGIGESETTSK